MKKWSVVFALLAVVLSTTGASATVLLYEDFEDEPVGWQFFGEVVGEPLSLWHRESLRSVSGNYSAAYNTGTMFEPNYTVDVGWNWGLLVSPSIDLSAATNIQLDFYSWIDSGDGEVGMAMIGIGGVFDSPWPPINLTTTNGQWNHLSADLSGLSGLSDVRLGFFYENPAAPDERPVGSEGWYIDDITLTADGGDPVPEPSTVMLLMSGLAGVGVVARRRFRK